MPDVGEEPPEVRKVIPLPAFCGRRANRSVGMATVDRQAGIPVALIGSAPSATEAHKLICCSVRFGESRRGAWASEMGAMPNVGFLAATQR